MNLDIENHWVCPNCTDTRITHRPATDVPFHPCKGLNGLSTPMVIDGVNCKVEAHERQDYINGEIVQTDKMGRPIMNVITTRDEGQDCVVYAPAATIGVGAVEPTSGKSGRSVSVGARTANVSGGSS